MKKIVVERRFPFPSVVCEYISSGYVPPKYYVNRWLLQRVGD